MIAKRRRGLSFGGVAVSPHPLVASLHPLVANRLFTCRLVVDRHRRLVL
jgi:hypothetical protein